MATPDRTQAESPTKGNAECKSTTLVKEASIETKDTGFTTDLT